MSRRLIIILSALAFCSYFGVIMIILGPLSGAGTTYYANKYVHKYALQRAPTIHWCKPLRWRSPAAHGAVALVSFPGSGNTWLRYLLQQLTGILTGSVYMDYGLRFHGFPAENVTDGSVLVVKTHENPPADPDQYKAAILLIRNPRDAILADYNWLHKGHIGTAPKSAFRRRSPVHGNSDWSVYVVRRLAAWAALHRAWLARFRRPVLAVHYEQLVAHTRRTLLDVAAFLNVSVTEEDMNCTLANREGIYRRKKRLGDFDPFTRAMYRRMARVSRDVLAAVAARHPTNWPGPDIRQIGPPLPVTTPWLDNDIE